jgi:hypothetical protein
MNAETGEHRIVASTGPYLIAWDFDKVKKNILDNYTVRASFPSPLIFFEMSSLHDCIILVFHDYPRLTLQKIKLNLQILKMNENVVDERFVFGNDNNIVVATKSHVGVRRIKERKAKN